MKHRFTLCLLFTIILISPLISWAQHNAISDFTVKENLSQNGKLAIIAVDSLEKTNNTINGSYPFSINGFLESLHFKDGVAVTENPIESSTFVFFKHKTGTKELGKLYFLRVSDNEITPYKINGFLLIMIPLLILYIAYKFKRFLITLLIIGAIYFYLNHSKGLDFSQMIQDTIVSLRDFI